MYFLYLWGFCAVIILRIETDQYEKKKYVAVARLATYFFFIQAQPDFVVQSKKINLLLNSKYKTKERVPTKHPQQCLPAL